MGPNFSDPAFWHRLQFGFTVSYHYLFPQLTMGLVWFIVWWKWKAFRGGEERCAKAVRFWLKIFGLAFGVGVVTGIPMEFQFGTNWAAFSRYSGEVIGQSLAMEGMFAFLLESAMIGALIWGEKRLGPRNHFLVAVGVAVGSWASAYFILVSNAFMQHPVGYTVAPTAPCRSGASPRFCSIRGRWWNSPTIRPVALVTGSFAVAALGAFYVLDDRHRDQARLYLKYGTVTGLIASILTAFPTGDRQAKMVVRYQEVSLAAMEGRFQSGPMAEIDLIGQPNVLEHRLDNPIVVPGRSVFSRMARSTATCAGWRRFRRMFGRTTSSCSTIASTSWRDWGRFLSR